MNPNRSPGRYVRRSASASAGTSYLKKSLEGPDDRRNLMGLSRIFSREPKTRLFFATDIHGSETCWRKFLNASKHYEADVLILGGDMTGKAIVPIVEQAPGRWRASLLENRYDFEGEEAVEKFEEMGQRRGSDT